MVKAIRFLFLVMLMAVFFRPAWAIEFDTNSDGKFDNQFKVNEDNFWPGSALREILDDDGTGSGLDADMLDGKHLQEIIDMVGGGTGGTGGGVISSVDNYPAVRAISGMVDGNIVYVSGEGISGWFVYDEDSTAADDDGTILQPDAGPGAWHRRYTHVLASWFVNALDQEAAAEAVIASIPNDWGYDYLYHQPLFEIIDAGQAVRPVDGRALKTDNLEIDQLTINGAEHYSGTGSPEGIVTAPVGSTYSRLDGGTGTTRYFKESGTGNTGWVTAGSGASTGSYIETVEVSGVTRAVEYKNSIGDTVEIKIFHDPSVTDYYDSSITGSIVWAEKRLQSFGGGIISVSAGVYSGDEQWTFDNDGAVPAKQKPIRIVGSGPTWSGRGAIAANGGTVFDMQYDGSTDNPATGKLRTNGLGHLEISGVTFLDSAGTDTPWIYTTNTTLNLHDNSFIGSKSGTSCDQDAIILGGTQTIEGQNGWDHGFQGYGTVIKDNYFSRIRRAIYGRTYANATVIRDNTIWATCGSNLADGAAIEFRGFNDSYVAGNTIASNLIEIVHYPYAIKIGWAVNNVVKHNGIFDATATSLAAVRLEENAVNNYIAGSMIYTGLDPVSDNSGTDNSNFIHTLDTSFPMEIKNTVDFYHQPIVKHLGKGVKSMDAAGNAQFDYIAGNGVQRIFKYEPAGGGNYDYAELRSSSDNSISRFILRGSSQNWIDLNGDANNYINAKAGSVLWLGDGADRAYIVGGGIHAKAGTGFFVGGTAGITQDVTVKGSAGNDCVLTVEGGIIVSSTCP